ncbi:heme-binding protein [Thiohalobacter sp. IOR34]|uniref:GlcG/HbpS family heme-binding protein n=1 Tax=Thiohalobacter sp. IOR34 TaxID=3057176 RepID=UPI0025B09B73|nr:heme-binding protein [Thiohalobacter sp. IOR34]WJW76404.1 heme-binding protein [Thiohalobacter sp. IOR34]
MKLFTVSIIAAALLAVSAQAADAGEPVVLPIPRLSMDLALKAAKAAIATCRKAGVNVGVTLVDRGGHPQVVLRDTLAMDLTLTLSRQKAYTALSFNTPSSQLAGRFPGAYSVPKIDGVLVAAGGLPITAGGAIIGGIGVSGAPSGKLDERCAQAGLDAINFDLQTLEF